MTNLAMATPSMSKRARPVLERVAVPISTRNPADDHGSFRFVEHLADLGRETREIEGLYNQLYARIESALMDDRILRITRREKDFQIATELSSFVCDLSAIEWSG